MGKVYRYGWTKDMLDILEAAKIDSWFKESCEKIMYLFPRAHALAIYNHYLPDINKTDEGQINLSNTAKDFLLDAVAKKIREKYGNNKNASEEINKALEELKDHLRNAGNE